MEQLSSCAPAAESVHSLEPTSRSRSARVQKLRGPSAAATETHTPRVCARRLERPLRWVPRAHSGQEPPLATTGEQPEQAAKAQRSQQLNT